MAELEIIVAGRKNSGKSTFIESIAQEIGEKIDNTQERTSMILKGTDIKINFNEYNLFLPYSEGPCILSSQDPFLEGKSDIFYFIHDFSDTKSMGTIISWLFRLQEKNDKKIIIYSRNLSRINEDIRFTFFKNLQNFVKKLNLSITHRHLKNIRNENLTFQDIQKDVLSFIGQTDTLNTFK